MSFLSGYPDDMVAELMRGCSSVGRAPALHAGGHRFDSVHLHQVKNLSVSLAMEHSDLTFWTGDNSSYGFAL